MASFEEEQAAIQRRQAIAQQLMQQGAQPMETNQVAGGYVVPISPMSGLAKVAQQLSGAYIGSQAQQRQTDLAQKKADMARALFAGSEPPTLDAIAASGLASPESMVAMGSNLMNAKAEHANKVEDRKLAAELAAKQHESDNLFRAQQAELARQQNFSNQQQLAQLAASLRSDPQVQVIGPNGTPVYMPNSQVTGMQPFNAQTLKQEQASILKDQQKNQAELSAQQALDQTAILAAHPGRKSGTGASSFMSKIPGTEAKGFQANLDTFKAQTFIPMVSALKGMGALSDAEGKKISESVGALDPSMPEAEFEKSLKEVSNYLYQKGKAAGLNVTLPDFAVGNNRNSIGGWSIKEIP